MPKVIPVAFVSSTMRDLEAFRERTMAVLRRNCVAYVAMEDFPADHLTPNENIEAKLEPCDLYIGILGGLYGSIPNGQDKSYTELEYRLALEYRKEALVFIADEQSFVGTASMFEHDQEKKKQLTSLRREWQKEHSTAIFTSQNFEQKLDESIKAFLKRHEADYQSMELACLPLDVPEKGWIADLYSNHPATVSNAIPNLANVRSALEHFYALLMKGDSSLREPLFMAFDQASCHLARVYDILGEMLAANDPGLVSRAVLAIGRHARARKVPDYLATRIYQLAPATDDDVRYEVAHALWKLPEWDRSRWRQCTDLASHMITDPIPRVSQRAQRSHQTLTNNR
jgi:hypothetical protein